MTADKILTRLTRLYPKAIEPGLERTLRILSDLGEPQTKLPPVIHIAGTNGKGSTLAFIRAMLEAAGKTCHIMTSPHLVKFNERFVTASEEITDAALEDLLLRVEKINAGQPITFFEIVTAAGLLAFAESRADYCLLETGMGGRLDCTNVVADPALTIITNISLDHTQHLGGTLEKIAFEKAGILKKNVPCVIGEQTKDALDSRVPEVFKARAAELNAPLYRHGREWNYAVGEKGFRVAFGGDVIECPLPNLPGAHQIANAAAAVVSMLLLSRGESRDKALPGLSNARWPARLQKIETGEFSALLPAGWELWLDGGHNEAGGKILADQAEAWKNRDGKPLHLVLGMLTTKDPRPFYDHLKPFISSATAVAIEGEKLAFDADALAEILSIDSAPSAKMAVEKISRAHPVPGRILITGSLYLAGKILSFNSAYSEA